jgi:stress-induced morphogen
VPFLPPTWVDADWTSQYDSGIFPYMNTEQMKKRLEENYPNSTIEVFDLTGTQDHWEVSIESSKFTGMTRIQQHQDVMGCFGPELKTGEVHALSIKTKIK